MAVEIKKNVQEGDPGRRPECRSCISHSVKAVDFECLISGLDRWGRVVIPEIKPDGQCASRVARPAFAIRPLARVVS